MHIADGFINQPTCVVTSGLAAASLIWAVQKARQTATPDSLKMLPAVTATVFAVQMLNFSVGGGMSGHLVGGALATILLGPALAIIAMATVILAQCLLLADGGVTALGANFLSMGVFTVVVTDFIWKKLQRNASDWAAAGLASLASIVTACFACTAFLAFSGVGSLQFATEMFANHSLVSLGEAGLTIGAVLAVRSASRPRRQIAILSVLAVSLFAMVPFASSLPDGLEAALVGGNNTITFVIGLVMSVAAVVIGLRIHSKTAREPSAHRIRN